MTDEQKIMMAYGVMRITLDEISKMGGVGSNDDLCDAINIARKAVKAVDELTKDTIK